MIERLEENRTKGLKKRFSGKEIKENPGLLDIGRRVFITKGEREKEGILGIITKFEPETKTLCLSSYDGKEKFSILIDEIREINFL